MIYNLMPLRYSNAVRTSEIMLIAPIQSINIEVFTAFFFHNFTKFSLKNIYSDKGEGGIFGPGYGLNFFSKITQLNETLLC